MPSGKSCEEEEDVNSLLKKILSEMKCIRANNKEFKQEMQALQKENNTLKKEVEETKEKLTQLEMRMEYYEKEIKKNNVLRNEGKRWRREERLQEFYSGRGKWRWSADGKLKTELFPKNGQ
ncbi:hypothetical protein ILUMI_08586 [Ignelater luminosus]|uniref:Uncharacterized protein n=1 Tax=Ignelater luminosus TaxID=2038154 RepID=A0A8K0D5Z8_IGNLU|nr:hypothetical protein ILUMI_08586 [Ignelater luminosus]